MRFRTIGIPALVGLLALAGCGEPGNSIELTIPTLPGDGTELRMFDARGGSWWNYRVHWTSRARKEVRLAARLVPPVPEGMDVVLKGDTKLRIGSEGVVTVVLVMPTVFGPVEGAVEFFSDDLPGWKKVFPFRGEVVDKPRRGRYIQARPPGIALGKLRPGETKPFESKLKNVGDEDITIQDWRVSNPDIVKMRPLHPNQILAPGDEIPIEGVVTVPRLAVGFREKIRVFSDASNYPQGVDITITGEVDPDFACNPRTLEVPADYPMRETAYTVEVVGRDGTDPFVIGSITGYEQYFTVGELSKEPAARQRVVFTLRRDAPTDARERQEFTVRFRIEPQDTDVVLPVRMKLLPPIHPSPASLMFGRVPLDRPARLEVRLQTFANRQFKVTKSYLEKGRFQISDPLGGGSLGWYFSVAPAPNLRPGVHRDTLVIETDDPDVPMIRVPIYLELTQ